jgi:dTMP kinase
VSQSGRFISLEGGEGVGKSTQVRALAGALKERGIDCLVTREPGGSEGAERIRDLLLNPREDWSASSEALLFAAARADHIEKTIRPALEGGRWVISDRFVDSSMAYQGGAGGIGIERIRALHEFGGGLLPDRTFVLTLDEGGERAKARDGEDADRIGGRGGDYHHKVDLAFRMIAAEEPERVRLVDASGSPEKVTQRLLDAIADLLP